MSDQSTHAANVLAETKHTLWHIMLYYQKDHSKEYWEMFDKQLGALSEAQLGIWANKCLEYLKEDIKTFINQ